MDNRLRPGDQILEVMKEDLRNVTHSFALHALRQTPNKVCVTGKLRANWLYTVGTVIGRFMFARSFFKAPISH